jgi:hypothetical protein
MTRRDDDPEPTMLRLILILTVVSLIAVPLLLGFVAVGTFLGVYVPANGVTGAPDWPFVVYGSFLLGIEWLCVGAVNGFIARKWFPHVRGGLFLAAGIPVLLVLVWYASHPAHRYLLIGV